MKVLSSCQEGTYILSHTPHPTLEDLTRNQWTSTNHVVGQTDQRGMVQASHSGILSQV